ncbi:MAG: hypothetical protein PHW75_01675 [Patescibacteria group bacterium]|nr:hypothetical protein [Patescibacteria group bacterium]
MRRRGSIELTLMLVVLVVFTVFFLALSATTALGVFVQNNEGDYSSDTISKTPRSTTLSSFVPDNYASILSEAEELTGTPAAIIGTVFLNEHHSLTFGSDLESLETLESPCDLDGPYQGPMQMGSGEWSAQISKLNAAGITDPDICSYRHSFIAAGHLLYDGKLKQDLPSDACLTDAGELSINDECVYWWVQAYCYGGPTGCTRTACSNSVWSYCEKAVEIYHLIIGEVLSV